MFVLGKGNFLCRKLGLESEGGGVGFRVLAVSGRI